MKIHSAIKAFLYKIFLWLSGSDTDLIAKCPRYEHIKHAMYGGLVIVPAIVGFIGMSYAISTITEQYINGHYFSFLLGLVWSIIVLIFDRYILATSRKSKSIIFFIIRIFLATFFGITVGHPLLLLVFSNRIEQSLHLIKKKGTAAIDSTWNNNSIKNIDNIILVRENLRDSLEIFNTNEISGKKYYNSLIGWTTGVSRKGDSAKNIGDRINKNKIILDTLKAQKQREIKKCELEKKEFEKKYASDYLARTNALHRLEQDKQDGEITRTTKYFIICFFVLIDILPITWKVLTKRSDYDEYIETSEYKTKTEQNTARVKIEEENKTAVLMIKSDEIHKRQALNLAAVLTFQELSKSKSMDQISRLRIFLRFITIIAGIISMLLSFKGIYSSGDSKKDTDNDKLFVEMNKEIRNLMQKIDKIGSLKK